MPGAFADNFWILRGTKLAAAARGQCRNSP